MFFLFLIAIVLRFQAFLYKLVIMADSEKVSTDSDTLCEETRKVSWKKSFDYVFCLAGMMIGLGNVWRFPYLCYKNGGGAFLIAYWAFLLLVIFPLAVLESAVGQLTGASPVKAWNLVPIFRGIGVTSAVVLSYVNIFYPVLLAWGLRWLIASFSGSMPWMSCDNYWNTNSCLPISLENATMDMNSSEHKLLNSSVHGKSVFRSSVEEFWRNNLLELSGSIDVPGGLKIDLTLCLLGIWIVAYFSIWKGIGWTSKIVYVTATLPIALILVVVIRGATLQGAGKGMKQYLKPNVTKLAEFEVWADAASQVLFSLGACNGCIVALSGYNKLRHNFFRDIIISTALNAFASFLAGFAIFSVLGYLADVKGTSIDDVIESGTDLAFIVYPTALSLLPLPQFWIALFFLTLLFLGFDSMFANLEAVISSLRDSFPKLFGRKWANEILIAILSLACFLPGLTMTTRGGIYILNILNQYSASGWCLFFVAMMESISIGWAYGADRMLDDTKRMLGYSLPRMFFKICWKFVIPSISLVLTIYSLVLYKPLEYDRDRVYPAWAGTLGWLTALSSILCIPVFAIITLKKAEGRTFMEKLRSSLGWKNSTVKQDINGGNRMKLISVAEKDVVE